MSGLRETPAKIATRPIDRLMILTAAFLFSTGGAAVKACSLTGWQVASFRSFVAALALLLLLPSARRGWNWKTWLVGSAYAGTMISFAVANKLTTAANTVFLQSTAPLYILLLGPILLSEPIRRRELGFMAALTCGMAMIFSASQPTSATAPNPLTGNIVGIAAGICWAFTIIGLRWLGRASHRDLEGATAGSAVICGNVIACLVTLPAAFPIRNATITDWSVVLFLGVFQIALAYVFLVRGVRRVGAFEASLLILLEPVLNPVWARLIHGELATSRAILGGIIIIGATAFHTWRSIGDEARK
jgi:drug/metabolite transporter (DMT)-like permease